MTEEELLAKAQKAYDDLMNEIDNTAGILKKYVDPDFNIPMAREKFDYILQSLMLIVTMTDHNMSMEEYNYMKNFTDKSDVMEEVNMLCNGSYSWENLITLNNEQKDDLMRAVRNVAIGESKAVIRDFAAADAYLMFKDDESILGNYVQPFNTILAGLSIADGTQSQTERRNANKAFRDIFYDRWVEERDRDLKILQEKVR